MESILTDIVYNIYCLLFTPTHTLSKGSCHGQYCFLFYNIVLSVVVVGSSLDLVVFSSVQPKIESEPEKAILELKKAHKKCLNLSWVVDR